MLTHYLLPRTTSYLLPPTSYVPVHRGVRFSRNAVTPS
jgi:hypothetical protein